MKCPRCRLINPPTALRCDCGYDFQKGTVEKPYIKQEPPKSRQVLKDIKIYLWSFVILNLLLAVVTMQEGDPTRIIGVLLWSVTVYWLYSQLAQRKNRARIALILLTFPIGLFLFFSRDVKMYFLQKD
jgi:hypothetical protein